MTAVCTAILFQKQWKVHNNSFSVFSGGCKGTLWKRMLHATHESIYEDQMWANIPAKLECCYAS